MKRSDLEVKTNRAVPNGYATLDTSGKLVATQIPDGFGGGGGGGGAPANMVTTDTSQTITGAKDFTGGLLAGGVGLVLTTDSRLSNSRDPNAHLHSAGSFDASGTPSATTFLRGDNVWAEPAAPTNAVTTDGGGSAEAPQIIIGHKRFTKSLSVVGDEGFNSGTTINIGVRDQNMSFVNGLNMEIIGTNSLVLSGGSLVLDAGPSIGHASLSLRTSSGAGYYQQGENSQRRVAIANNASSTQVYGTAQLSVTPSSAASSGVIVRGVDGQSGNLNEWQNNLGVILARVSYDGTIYKGTEIIGAKAQQTEIMSIMGAF